MARGTADLPECLSGHRKFFKRAEEMKQAGERNVEYACKLQILQDGMEAMKTHPQDKAAISAVVLPLMQDLENLKNQNGVTDTEAKVATLRVANSEFQEGDARDRAGQPDKVTVSKLNNASILFEVGKQFGALSGEDAQKAHYATSRCKVLAQAIQQKQPPPPPQPMAGPTSSPTPSPTGQGMPSMPMPSMPMPGGLPPGPPSLPGGMPAGGPPGGCYDPAGAAPGDAPKAASKSPPVYEPVHTGPPNPIWDEPRSSLQPGSTAEDYKAEARKQSQYAASALMFQDVQTALQCTNCAIALLRATPECQGLPQTLS